MEWTSQCLGNTHHRMTGHLFHTSQLMTALTAIKASHHGKEVKGCGTLGHSNRKEVLLHLGTTICTEFINAALFYDYNYTNLLKFLKAGGAFCISSFQFEISM